MELFLDQLNLFLQVWGRQSYRLVLHQPDRFEGGRVVGQPGNHMPVDVGELVAEEFVVHLLGVTDLCQDLGDAG